MGVPVQPDEPADGRVVPAFRPPSGPVEREETGPFRVLRLGRLPAYFGVEGHPLEDELLAQHQDATPFQLVAQQAQPPDLLPFRSRKRAGEAGWWTHCSDLCQSIRAFGTRLSSLSYGLCGWSQCRSFRSGNRW